MSIAPAHRSLVRIGLLLLGALVTACAGPQARYGGDRYAGLDPKAYSAALEANTREVELYQEFDTRLLARATLLTPGFRKHYAREYARVYRLSEAEQGAMEQKQETAGAEAVEILVWLASAEPKQASLAEKDNIWKLKLYDTEGRWAAPTSITWVKKPSEVDQHFYPYFSGYGRVYQLKFPSSPEGGAPFLSGSSVTLQFAGVLGVAEISWPLEAGGAAGAVSAR